MLEVRHWPGLWHRQELLRKREGPWEVTADLASSIAEEETVLLGWWAVEDEAATNDCAIVGYGCRPQAARHVAPERALSAEPEGHPLRVFGCERGFCHIARDTETGSGTFGCRLTWRFSCARAKRSVSAATAGYAAVPTVSSARQGWSKRAGERGKGDRGSPGGTPGPASGTWLEGTVVEGSARTERNRAVDRPGAGALRGRAGQRSLRRPWRHGRGARRRRETNRKAAWRAERSDEARYGTRDGAKAREENRDALRKKRR